MMLVPLLHHPVWMRVAYVVPSTRRLLALSERDSSFLLWYLWLWHWSVCFAWLQKHILLWGSVATSPRFARLDSPLLRRFRVVVCRFGVGGYRRASLGGLRFRD